MGSDFVVPEHEFTLQRPGPWSTSLGGPWYSLWRCKCTAAIPPGLFPWKYIRAATESELAAKMQETAIEHSE